MNSLRNNVTLIGNIGQAPEFTQLGDGKSVLKFSMATNESYKNKAGEWETDTQWHNCIAWNKTGEICKELFEKGTQVMISGKLSHRSYDNKQGEKRYITEVVMKEFAVLKSDKKEQN